MTRNLTEWVSGSSRQAALYPRLCPAGIPLVSGRTGRRMDYLTETLLDTRA
jgi:hypothetical protein